MAGQRRWVWGIDTVIPMREADQTGFGGVGEASLHPANLSDFMRMKRQRLP